MKLGKSYTIELGLFLVFMLLEFFLRLEIGGSFSSIALVYMMLFTLSFVTFLSYVASFFTRPVRKAIFACIGLVFTLYVYSQFMYYKFFQMFYPWKSFFHAGQIAEFSGEIFSRILALWPNFLLFFLPISFYVFWLRTYKGGEVQGKPKYNLLLLSMFFFLLPKGIMGISPNKSNSAYDVYNHERVLLLSADRLGLFSASRLDFQRTIFRRKGVSQVEKKAENEAEPGGMVTFQGQSLSVGEMKGQLQNKFPRKQVLDVDFENFLDQGDTGDLLAMAQYFEQLEPTYTNDHTGKFKGYNVIFVTAESYSRFVADPVLTPTLWKMETQGMQFNNYYCPVWSVSTSDGEYVGLTGLYPREGIWSLEASAEKDMAMAPGNVFSREGYRCFAYHPHTYTYYGRDLSHPNLGYLYKGVGNGLEVTESWPESDVEMVENSIQEYVKKSPFHVYYMSVSGHLEYNFMGNAMSEKNRHFVEDLPLSQEAKAYLACQIELDRAMELLLKRLNEQGIAEKTLIIINPDHYPYGLTKEAIDELAGEEVDPRFELYRSSLIFYAQGMEPEEVDKLCSSVDLLPTLYNLMGIPYDSRLFSGRDIFYEEEPLVQFVDGSWITSRGRYDAVLDQYYPKTASDSDSQYVEEIQKKVRDRFIYSSLIHRYDYYSLVLPKPFRTK